VTDDVARALALAAAVDAQRDRILDVTRFVNRHPELAHEEFACARHIATALAPALDVETTLTGMATGFRATLAGASPGPAVALVAVYDAVGVPDGDGTLRAVHSCGHGPVSGAVVGAALALASLRETFAGSLTILGCPADELVSPLAIRRGSGKALALAGGAWSGIDYALYAHPESHTGVWRSSRWMQLFAVTVPGTADPASWGLPADRYRIDELTRVGPDTEVTLRVLGDDAEEIGTRAEDARAALSPRSWTPLGRTEGLTADERVAAAAEQSLSALGIRFDPRTPQMPFSTDFGNVSRQVPAAMIGFSRPGPDGWAVHLDQGEQQFLSGEGETLALTMSAALAVAADRLTRPADP
jgi:metal-dependent amidase/aminoacylase/carboxypeptidase family protein